jgi:amino acid efflux transporter
LEKATHLKKSLTALSGAAMTTGSVLGAGIMVLPAITAVMAGPASVLSWIVTGILTLPMIFIIGRLAMHFPEAGGMAAYVRHGLGPRYSSWLSLLMMTALPFGMPITALIGANYLGNYCQWSQPAIYLCAGAMITAAVCLNYRGIQLAGRIQVVVVGFILLVLLAAIFSGLPEVRLSAFTPFAPQGWFPVLQAAALTFFAFTGWEMIGYLAEEFRDPAHDIPRSLGIAALIINILYIAISFVIVGTAAYQDSSPLTALVKLISFQGGNGAVALISVLGCAACYCPVHIYIAGLSRLIYAQARAGELPPIFARLHPRFQTPHYALLAFLPAALLVLAISCSFSFDLQALINLPSANFLLIYVIGMAAACRLLPRPWEKLLAGISTLAMGLLYLFIGRYLLFSIIISLLFFLKTALLPHLHRTLAGKTDQGKTS